MPLDDRLGRETVSGHRGGEHVSIDEKVAFLRRPEAYPDGCGRVDVKESHMSWVFLTGKRVYKLKKPVRNSFLDFGTVAARRVDGEGEVRLNSRLSPRVYLGLVSLTREGDGSLVLDGDGEVVDWLVHMVRLDEDRTLERRIERQSVQADDIRGLAELLSRFYADAKPVIMTPTHYRARFLGDIRENRAELARAEFGLDAGRVERLSAAQHDFVEDRAALLDARAAEKRIIDAHGDLRPEHVYLGDPPDIIDCLEFNRDLRLLDPVDELAFLALECRRLGNAAVGDILFAQYTTLTDDAPPAPLIHFYAAFRALIRAKLAVWHLTEPERDDHDKWVGRANHYLDLAEDHTRGFSSPSR